MLELNKKTKKQLKAKNKVFGSGSDYLTVRVQLSGRAAPCQGACRAFESRYPLSLKLKALETNSGKVAEWLNASVLKTDVVARLPGVRIPPFPKLFYLNSFKIYQINQENIFEFSI